jgi:hypothetical protein
VPTSNRQKPRKSDVPVKAAQEKQSRFVIVQTTAVPVAVNLDAIEQVSLVTAVPGLPFADARLRLSMASGYVDVVGDEAIQRVLDALGIKAADLRPEEATV